MANNIVLSAGAGGDTIRTIDRAGIEVPVSLIDVGGTAAEALVGDAGVGMPVKGLGTAGTANSAVLTIQGIASMTPVQVADNGGALTVDNAGMFVVQVDGAALTALQLIDDVVFVDDAAFTPATSKVQAIGMQADETATDSVDEGDVGCPRMTLDRKQHVVAALSVSELRNGGTAVAPAFAIIDAATSGDNTLLAAQGASNKIRVHALYLIAAGTVTVRFESGASGTALSGQMNLVANSGFVLPFNPLGWFETAANTLLNLELSGAISVDGGFQYSVVT